MAKRQTRRPRKTEATTIPAALLAASVLGVDTSGLPTLPDRRNVSPNPPPEADRRTNPFSGVFGAVIFSPISKDTVYTNAQGVRSKQVADCLVPIVGTKAHIPGSIYHRQAPGATVVADFVFTGNRGKNAVVTDDLACKQELDLWRAGVAARWVAYYETNKSPLVTGQNPTTVAMPGLTL